MPSSSVFGRLTGKKQQGLQQYSPESTSGPGGRLSSVIERTSIDGSTSPPLGAKTVYGGHRRESSIQSLTNSVTDLGNNVRRSVSLRSHRTRPSTSSLGPGRGSYLAASAERTESEATEPQQTRLATPPRSRTAPTSTRSFSQRFSSIDAPVHIQGVLEADKARPLAPMLAAPSIPARPPPNRPVLAPHASFSSVRDVSASQHSLNGGAPLQHISTAPAMTASTTGGHNPYLVHQTIHETAAKRMATIDYLRQVHEGNIFYFSTLHYTPAALSNLPSLQQHKLGRRAANYLLLGYSLPAVLEINSNSPLDYLKSLYALLQEFETYQQLSGLDGGGGNSLSRGRVGQMFKAAGAGLTNRSAAIRTGRRASAASDSFNFTDAQRAGSFGLPPFTTDGPHSSPLESSSPVNTSGHDFHHLLTPHLPFEPDFATTFATLCETLIDTYVRLLELAATPEVCSVAVGEAFAKADKGVRKILVANVVGEFEGATRTAMKSEVGGLGKLVLGGLM